MLDYIVMQVRETNHEKDYLLTNQYLAVSVCTLNALCLFDKAPDWDFFLKWICISSNCLLWLKNMQLDVDEYDG